MFGIFKRRDPAQVIQVVDGRVDVTLSVRQKNTINSHVTRCKLHVLPKAGSKIYISDAESKRAKNSGIAIVKEVYPCVLTDGIHYMVKCSMVKYDRDIRCGSKNKDPYGIRKK